MPAVWNQAATILMVVLVTGCYPRPDVVSTSSEYPVVEVVELAPEPVVTTVELLGRIEPWQEATLYFEVSGIVAEMLVEEGEVVAKASAIARLVADDFQLNLERVTAELRQATAELSLLQAGTRREDLAVAAAVHARSQARIKFWENELTRRQNLAESGSVSAADLDEGQREYAVALEDAGLAKAEWDRALAGPRREQIEAASAIVQARQRIVALAQRELEKATLRAPFAGRIERRLIDMGGFVNLMPTGGAPIVHLVDLERVDAVLDVAEPSLPDLARVVELEVASAIRPEVRRTGRVISLGKIAHQATGTYQLRVRLDNCDGLFAGGMIITAAVTRQATDDGLLVPLMTLRGGFGQPLSVWLVDMQSSSVVSRSVRVGPIQGDRIEIVSGLVSGEQLIVRGHDKLAIGERVRPRWARELSLAGEPEPRM